MTLRRRPGTPTREPPSESEKAWAISIRFSNWSPLASQAGRKQLFAERCALVCNWFDAWNEEERCSFTCGLLARCSPAQLRWAREWLVANVPPERADFSTLLPRALSLRILGLLSPRDLSRAAQVCWRWRFLAEQDVIWVPKCVNQGWFLPYSPCETEFGAWKRHYIQCVTSLDWTHPPQDQTQNRENPQRVKSAAAAKQRARATRRWLKRQSTTWKRQQEDIICSRSAIVPCHALAILDGALRCPSDVSREVNQRQLGGSTELMDTVRATRRKLVAHSPCMCKAVGCPALPTTQGLPETIQAGLSCCRPAEQTLLVLISSAVPAPELLLAAVKTRVKSLLYDYRVDSLDCLLRRVEATLGNQEASGIAVITDGDAGEIRLLSCVTVSAKNLQVPEVRDFWERLSGCLCLGEDGGHLDIFHPLKSSEGGVQLMGQLEEVFESRVTSPASALPFTFWQDDCEWSWTPPDGSDVPSLYFSRDHLMTWGRVSDSMAEATKASRQHLQPFLAQLGREVLDRAVGQLLFENLSVVQVMTYQEAGLAVAEAFFALARRKSMACPVEFLARFLRRRCERKGCQHVGERKDLPERETQRSANSQPQNSATTSQAGPRQHAVGHEVMAAEIMRSETVYMRTLESLKEVYASPLKAALASGRPIISATNVQVIVSDPLHILELHRDLCRGLQVKMVEGGPEHSLGEVFSRFMKKLSVYTSFFNNYSHVLQTIEECRDDSPAFRAFLKSRDYSLSTRMLSLPELLLEVARRLPCLLYELRSLHLSTSFDNSDRVQIAAAADTLQNYCNFIKTVKGRIQREALLCEVQQSIVACPKLQERHRFFICQQDVANLRRHANDPRIYEHFQDLGLFLFNDALVFTTCSVTHSPFERSRKTRHHFYASVSLTCLHLDDISDCKYVCNAFRLCGTRQEWTCAVDTSEEKLTWLAALNAAIRSANWT